MPAARKRTSIRARAAAANAPTKPRSSKTPTLPSHQAPTGFRAQSKSERRLANRAELLTRVREGGIRKQASSKVRRPGKKLKSAESLGELRDALDDISGGEDGEEEEDGEEWIGLSDEDMDGVAQSGSGRKRKRKTASSSSAEGGKMVMKSLQHRPGAMKRKHKMERLERDRFGKNLAQLSGSQVNAQGDVPAAQPGVTPGEKWAALRRFIGGTMERDQAFGAG